MFSDRGNVGRKRKNVVNKHKKCSTRYCNTKVNTLGTDNYCTDCRQAINHRNWLKRKGLYDGNYLYVYFSHLGALYVGLTHNYDERHKQHLKSDKRFIEEDLWQYRVVYEFSDEIKHKELEYLEYILIQYHKNKSDLLTNYQKINKNNYKLIPEHRKRELKVMLRDEMVKNNVVNLNNSYRKALAETIELNYLQKKNSLFGDKGID